MRLKICSITASLILLAGGSSFTQDLQQTRRFADSLHTAGLYAEALPLYQRVAYFSPVQSDPEILLRLAEGFHLTGDLNHALEYYDHAYFSQPSDSQKIEVLFKKSACYLQSHNYNFALIELLSLDDDPQKWFHHRLNFYLGMAWFGAENFEKSRTCFLKAAFTEIQKQEISRIFDNPKNLHRPNPRTASWLSVFIPGSGQFYSGNPADGINSMLLTGSFIALSLYLAVVSTPLDAILTALPWFQRYYQGGFERAEELAKGKRARNRSLAFDRILTILEPSGNLP